jgi:hypothetical protein
MQELLPNWPPHPDSDRGRLAVHDFYFDGHFCLPNDKQSACIHH